MPSNLDNIRTEIKNILNSVPGTGLIYDELILAKTEDEFKKKFVKDDKINVVMFFQAPRKVVKIYEGWEEEEVERTFVFTHYYGVKTDENSGKRTEDYLESVINAFNSNSDLNGAVKEHSKMDLMILTPATFGNTLVHLAMLEITTTETNIL